VAELIKNHENP